MSVLITVVDVECVVVVMHYAHVGWMDDVHSGNKAVKIVPRLLFEGWTANSLIGLFRSEEQVRSMSGVVAAYLKVG